MTRCWHLLPRQKNIVCLYNVRMYFLAVFLNEKRSQFPFQPVGVVYSDESSKREGENNRTLTRSPNKRSKHVVVDGATSGSDENAKSHRYPRMRPCEFIMRREIRTFYSCKRLSMHAINNFYTCFHDVSRRFFVPPALFQ